MIEPLGARERACRMRGDMSLEIFEYPDFDGHEQVLFCTDAESGLQAIIAIHSTRLGPAAGGCRMYPYDSTQTALADVLRLSRGMSYKNALAGLPLGGGKSVILADPTRPDKKAVLRAFSKHVQLLSGRYWTAIDMGVGPADADVLAENCDFVFARASQYETGFSPSSFTALGGFTGIRAAVSHVWGKDDLAGVRVAIQGLGATGADLARQLHEAGARLIVSDIREEATRSCVERYGAQAVSVEQIHTQDVDVFAPCAMGAILNDRTIPEIAAKVICGVANNQLAESRHGAELRRRGIVYVPDYVVNAGGMIGAGTVIFEEPSRESSMRRILGLFETIREILKAADEANRAASDMADELAMSRIASGRPLG